MIPDQFPEHFHDRNLPWTGQLPATSVQLTLPAVEAADQSAAGGLVDTAPAEAGHVVVAGTAS